MKQLQFSVDIKAPAAKVWEILWNDATYREWTNVFMEGSHVVTDWKEGSKVLFLGPTDEGMYSEIAKKNENEFMSFRHLGMVKDGKELPNDDESKAWSGSMENYTLKEINGITTLIVNLDTVESHSDYFNQAFPQALQKVKEIAEKA